MSARETCRSCVPSGPSSPFATEQDAERRAAWQAEQPAFVPEDLVFLDETGTQTTLTRTHGRAPKGERLVATVPRNHGPNVTCLAALTATGVGPCLHRRAGAIQSRDA